MLNDECGQELEIESTLQRARSVLSRAERLAELKEAGKWRDGESVFGLVKVKVRRVKRRKAAKVEGAEAAPGRRGRSGRSGCRAGGRSGRQARRQGRADGAPAERRRRQGLLPAGGSGCQRRRKAAPGKGREEVAVTPFEFARREATALASLLFRRAFSGGFR